MAVIQNTKRIARIIAIAGPPVVLAILASRFGMWDGPAGAIVVLAIGVWIGASALYTRGWTPRRKRRRR